MRINITEKQLEKIVNNQIDEQLSTDTNASSSDTTTSNAAVTTWPDSITRGPDNILDYKTKWEDVVGSQLKRGNANPLN